MHARRRTYLSVLLLMGLAACDGPVAPTSFVFGVGDTVNVTEQTGRSLKVLSGSRGVESQVTLVVRDTSVARSLGASPV